ncbi:endonuclease domain-containing protein [Owenweeksia hongkongensis]|uniref:endonuclease domain-containing protein n=1 Tax=Owenweeksia hongkongensis TaxID=253245 RepID=UPI003A8EC76C
MPKTYSINGVQLKTNYLKLFYNPKLKQRARTFRKARNLPEVLFWVRVNKGQFYGLDFDRQKIVGNYIVDFYCKSLGLIVEIDGSSHLGREEEDAVREAWLSDQGCRIIRFTTVLILEHMDQVIEELEDFVLENYT